MVQRQLQIERMRAAHARLGELGTAPVDTAPAAHAGGGGGGGEDSSAARLSPQEAAAAAKAGKALASAALKAAPVRAHAARVGPLSATVRPS